MKYSGADWIAAQLPHWKKPAMSPFGALVADILGAAYLGIYHVPSSALVKAEWDNPHFVQVSVYSDLATYDSDLLTRLVVLAHDACVRFTVDPCNMRYVRLVFHRRNGREGRFYERHPTMEDAVARVRSSLGFASFEDRVDAEKERAA